MTTDEVVDQESLEMLQSVMGEEFEELVELYLEDAGRHLADLHAAVASQECEAVIALAHSIKGASANVYAVRMARHCLELEETTRSMKQQPDWQRLAVLLANVQSAFGDTRAGFEGFLR